MLGKRSLALGAFIYFSGGTNANLLEPLKDHVTAQNLCVISVCLAWIDQELQGTPAKHPERKTAEYKTITLQLSLSVGG